MKVIIIGAGHNGLAAAYYLARSGLEVTVVDQLPRPGGMIEGLEINGARISRTAYVLGLMPEDMVAEFGIPVIRQDPYQVLFVDGKVLPFWRDPARRREALRAVGYENLVELDERLEAFRAKVMSRFTYVTKPPSRDEFRELAGREGLGEFIDRSAEGLLRDYGAEDLKYFYIYPGMESSPAMVIAYYYAPWSFVKGGMQEVINVMARKASEVGARLLLGRVVDEILVSDSRVLGVRLRSSEVLNADAVIFTGSPIELPNLLPDLPEARELRRLRVHRASWVKHNVVLEGFPRLPEPLVPYAGSIIDSECGELVIPSVVDDSRGAHVAEFMGSYDCVMELLGVRAAYHDMVDAEYAERAYMLPGGNVNHLPMAEPYLFDSRPAKGWAYRTPVRGLYVGGSGTYPGGQVTGVPGRNAASALLEDLRLGALRAY